MLLKKRQVHGVKMRAFGLCVEFILGYLRYWAWITQLYL